MHTCIIIILPERRVTSQRHSSLTANVIANPINIMAMKTVVLLLLISLSRHGTASEANIGATPNRDSFLNELSTVASHQGMINSVFKTNKLLNW